MPNTPRGFPYPSLSNIPDVPADLQALATAVDGEFTQLQLDGDYPTMHLVGPTSPGVRFRGTGGAVDQKDWGIYRGSDGELRFRAYNDSGTIIDPYPLSLRRDGRVYIGKDPETGRDAVNKSFLEKVLEQTVLLQEGSGGGVALGTSVSVIVTDTTNKIVIPTGYTASIVSHIRSTIYKATTLDGHVSRVWTQYRKDAGVYQTADDSNDADWGAVVTWYAGVGTEASQCAYGTYRKTGLTAGEYDFRVVGNGSYNGLTANLTRVLFVLTDLTPV